MRPTSEISIYLGVADKTCFLTFKGPKVQGNVVKPLWTKIGPISKDSLLTSEAKLAGRRDDLTLQCAALPYLLTCIPPFSIWLSFRQSAETVVC